MSGDIPDRIRRVRRIQGNRDSPGGQEAEEYGRVLGPVAEQDEDAVPLPDAGFLKRRGGPARHFRQVAEGDLPVVDDHGCMVRCS